MTWKLSRYRTGDLVEIRSKEEILATLDQHGCLDGMPFMPEMVQFCGQRFRVSAVAHKTCDTARQTGKGRRLRATVHLAGLHCDGLSHGGCQAECNLFWKDEWLKPAADNRGDSARPAAAMNVPAGGCTEAKLLANTHLSSDAEGEEPRYSCQATEMYKATQPLAWWDVRQYVFDVVTGNHSVGRVLRVLFLASLRWLLAHVPYGYRLFKRFHDWMHQWLSGRASPSLHGQIPDGVLTPTGRLDLKPGEYVRIKTQAEIEKTIGMNGRNRGLSFDPEEMAPYCGRVVKVRKSVTKIIDEPTGRMLHMKQSCIMLEGVVCKAEYASCRLNCPREIPAYWREIWLERVEDDQQSHDEPNPMKGRCGEFGERRMISTETGVPGAVTPEEQIMAHPSRRVLLMLILLLGLGLFYAKVQAAPPTVLFTQSTTRVEAYDFVEVTLQVEPATVKNPFADVLVQGKFRQEGAAPIAVEGFCDSADGTVYHIRFMPAQPGKYEYSITYQQGDFSQSHTGTFEVKAGKRRGILRVDKDYPWHFIWEGTGEHYFFNGTTAFLLMSWQDEKVIRDSIDRLHRLKVNRMRVLLGGGRSASFWSEPIIPNGEFQPSLNPWIALRPNDRSQPDFDYTRFNVPYWQKFERMLRHARQQDMVISVVFDWNDSPVHPAADSEDERRYFHYAAARLSVFSNVTWDLGDDISSYRSLDWSHRTGTLLHQWDPYHHLATDHPADNKHQDRTAEWFSFTSFQEWHRPLHQWMLDQRKAQAKTGRIIPQANEEYGYEEHYPSWSPNKPDSHSADANRRVAWEMAIAGTYQTTGETAKRGTGVGPDTGGGWVNGRGDDTMVMLQGYAYMVDFFTTFEWWKADPHDELVNHGAYCLAEPGRVYAVYLQNSGDVTVKLAPGRYQVSWFNPRTGKTTSLPAADGPVWTSPKAPDSGDWALLLRK